VNAQGAEGIAQFMPQTGGWRGLAGPRNPIEALRHSTSYLHASPTLRHDAGSGVETVLLPNNTGPTAGPFSAAACAAPQPFDV
jgi:hypothetical protein